MKKIIFLLALVVLSVASCVKDTNAPTIRTKGAGDVTFTVNIPSGVVNTRSVAAVEGENNVNDLTLMFFEKTNNAEGLFKAAYQVPDEELPTDGRFVFDLYIPYDEIGLDKASSYTVLAMANMMDGNYYIDQAGLDAFLAGIEGKIESEVTRSMTRQIVGVGEDQNDNSKVIAKDNIPMTVRFSAEASQENITMELTRVVSRFDIINKAPGYTLVSASIWNAFTFPNFWATATPDYATKGNTKRYYGVGITGKDSIVGGLYTPENISTSPTQNDTTTTCLIVGLKNDTTNTVYYYRLNMHKSGSGQYLVRNNVYRATISGVAARGEATEVDAYSGGQFLLDVSVNPWESDENGLVITKGDMMLALPTRKAVFGPDATEKQYYVYTKGGPEGTTLQLVNLELPEGITTRLDGNNLYIKVTQFTDIERKGSIELRYGELSGVIEIIQRGEFIKYLDLNYTDVSPYPAGAAENMIPNTKPIEITSSGPWTATIMGGSSFSFSMSYFISELKGENEDMISAVYSRGPNPGMKDLTNVVLITLDEDPENYRSVLVLTQKGSGEYTWTPALEEGDSIYFDASTELSKVKGKGVNMFELQSKDNMDSWNVKLTGSDPYKFQLISYATNGDSTIIEAGEEIGAGPTDYLKFKVVAVAANYTGKYNANLDVYHNGALTRVPLAQDVFEFGMNIVNKQPVEPIGGTREVAVSFAGGSSATMNATLQLITTEDIAEGQYVPMIKLEDGTLVTELTGVPVSNFTVVIPTINPPFGYIFKENPEIKVTVTIGELTKSESIIQKKINFPSSLNVHTLHNTYGRWTTTDGLFDGWRTVMGNPSLFGPSGTVWAPSSIGGFDNIDVSTVTAPDVRIWNVNQNNYNTGNARLSGNWMGKENHFVILSTYNQYNMFPYIFGSGNNGGYSCQNGYGNDSRDQTPNSAPTKSRETELWKYLVGGDGPFGEVDVTAIRNLGGGDDNAIGLTQWPSNFIPLIMSSRSPNRCMVGIDPTNRFIWVGDTEIFNSNRPQNNYGNLTSEESKFFQNIIAYIINVTLYGDAFNDQFKVK